MWEKKALLKVPKLSSLDNYEPNVYFDAPLIDFGSVQSTTPAPFLLKLINKSDVTITGDWMCDETGYANILSDF